MFATDACALKAGRKRGWPKADEHAADASITVRKRRVLVLREKDGAPIRRTARVSQVDSCASMAAPRFSRIAWTIRGPCAIPTLRSNSPRTSIRQFTQTAFPFERNKANHHDVRSYLEYLERNGKDPNSNIAKGTRFEYRAIEALKPYGLDLGRVGKTGDKGKDVVGVWKLHKHTKGHPNEIRVLGQCKAKKVGPEEVRGLIGTSSGARHCLKYLMSTHESTKGVSDEIDACTEPMGFIQITVDGDVLQWFWNDAATQAGLVRYGTTMRYRNSPNDQGTSCNNRDNKPIGTVVLTVDGKLWRPRARKPAKTAKAKRNVTMPNSIKRKRQKRELSTSDDQASED